ncbi:hypothetical protein RHODO2019_15470 [Rhodococcus antarcticus]|uniref:Uncharacterized protein n=1 Tax=Rhodococcus antarcticus TaxID=2987751 RepID=A0ABY6NYP5_9NOCA|nr:hypothetical protein [Rhodococcus antarcticus]UZJ24512.1 hypothetical protein RHODO2019_15470 [Rhodococcus antarcticus]
MNGEPPTAPDIAGTLHASTLMRTLGRVRPLFHSEADFQFAFAQAVVAADPTLEVRLEVRQSAERAEYVDLACWSPNGTHTLIEFKYATAGWDGTDSHGEAFTVRHHGAYDLTRRYYIHDVHRLERFTAAKPRITGLAILLTNEPSLWNNTGRPGARDANFRLHEGRTLGGHLVWGTGTTPKYDQDLTGTYSTQWQDYSMVDDGPRGRFRWLGLHISPILAT